MTYKRWLLLLGSCACTATTVERGVTVQLDAAVEAPEDGVFRESTQGSTFAAQRAELVLYSMALVVCEDETDETQGLLERLWRWGTGVEVARAHDAATPLAFVEPQVLDLLGDSRVLGAIKPPPGSYCGLQVRLAPADADVAGLDGNEDLIGYGLWLEGVWTTATGDAEDVLLRSASARDATYYFPDGEVVALSEDQDFAELQLRLDPTGLLEGVNTSMSEAVVGAVVLQNFLLGLTVEVLD